MFRNAKHTLLSLAVVGLLAGTVVADAAAEPQRSERGKKQTKKEERYPSATRTSPETKSSPKLGKKIQKLIDAFNDGKNEEAKPLAEELGLVGPAARASGCARDVRRDFPTGAYQGMTITPAPASPTASIERCRRRFFGPGRPMMSSKIDTGCMRTSVTPPGSTAPFCRTRLTVPSTLLR